MDAVERPAEAESRPHLNRRHDNHQATTKHSASPNNNHWAFPRREELKNEQRIKELTAEVQTKQEEAQALAQVTTTLYCNKWAMGFL